ncbi:MAG: hypothetical protein ACRCZ0_01220 [Cetobacterium sp.]
MTTKEMRAKLIELNKEDRDEKGRYDYLTNQQLTQMVRVCKECENRDSCLK